MVNHEIAVFIYRNAMALFCAASIAASPITPKECIAPLQPVSEISTSSADSELLMRTMLWQYLRSGLNYLEASGKEVPPDFKHPGGKAYGPLALTPVAIKDVQRHCPALARYTLEDVLSSRELYEKFAFYYADLLLRHYLKMDYFKMPKEEVFDVLEKAWFWGPTLYREGRPAVSSREVKSMEFRATLPLTVI